MFISSSQGFYKKIAIFFIFSFVQPYFQKNINRALKKVLLGGDTLRHLERRSRDWRWVLKVSFDERPRSNGASSSTLVLSFPFVLSLFYVALGIIEGLVCNLFNA